jgi:hypothetical protein
MPLKNRIELLRRMHASEGDDAVAAESMDPVRPPTQTTPDTRSDTSADAQNGDGGIEDDEQTEGEHVTLDDVATPVQTFDDTPATQAEYAEYETGDIPYADSELHGGGDVFEKSLDGLRTLAVLQLAVGAVILAERVVGGLERSEQSPLVVTLVGVAMVCMVSLCILMSVSFKPGYVTKRVAPLLADGVLLVGLVASLAAVSMGVVWKVRDRTRMRRESYDSENEQMNLQNEYY